MKYIFNLMTSISLKLRWLVIVSIFVLLALGAVAAGQLNQELIPPIEFPQTIILAQTSGMTSEQVMKTITERLEPALADIEEIINLESTTTGAFGSVIVAFNDFGLDQRKLQAQIGEAIDEVWLPLRRIEVADGQDPQEFSQSLLGDLTPDILIYLTIQNSNFLFNLSPEVWSTLSDETVEQTLAFLANQTDASTNTSNVLEGIVEEEIVPQLKAIDNVINVAIDGGQIIPGQENVFGETLENREVKSLLLRLSPEVWDIVSSKIDNLNELNGDAVETLAKLTYDIPSVPPALPESWQQYDHFSTADDLLEVATLTKPVASILNDFYDDGLIIGALGQTDDLTPETVTSLLNIDPSLVYYLEAEHLNALPQEVLDVLPDEYFANLNGFTRDALAARALAQSISEGRDVTTSNVERHPVDLPDAWRIQQPQIITFSFADLPLATFSVASVGALSQDVVDDNTETVETNEINETTTQTTEETNSTQIDKDPNAPSLPAIWAMAGNAMGGAELDSADDLFILADSVGTNVAGLLNAMTSVPEAATFAPLLLGGFPVEIIEYVLEKDPTALDNLTLETRDQFPEAVREILPYSDQTLAGAWNTLSSQPQFGENPLIKASDLIKLGNGSAATILNIINENISDQYKGYEIRLFDSLTPSTIAFFIQSEPDFYQKLDNNILLKFNAEVLAQLPKEFISELDENISTRVTAIASGEENSAFTALQAEYSSNIAAADPNAPELNPQWHQLETPFGIELDTADDFFRFPEGFQYEDASALINGLFDNPQGANFAPALLGETPVEVIQYILNRDASVLANLNTRALQLFSEEVFSILPDSLQQRAIEGGEQFLADNLITRTNSQSSLIVTVFKSVDANTVSTYADVEELIFKIGEENANIEVGVIFEQSSFIEESISGVAREGGLGAVFAVIIILTFLSSGVWNLKGRRRAGVIITIIFMLLLLGLIFLGYEDAGNDFGEAFSNTDIVFRVLLMVGILFGVTTIFWPGDLPDPAWRATLVIAISIPLSILMALIGMRWLSPAMFNIIQPLSENSSLVGDIFTFLLRIFPEELSMNIMTLSGLTVAVGRVVDDAIVVLENIFRNLEEDTVTSENKMNAILEGTRDVSAAIFVATLIAMVVFLPLGLTGGIIGAFFLPFGLAVTYALGSSFIVAITVIPVLAYIFIKPEEIPEEGDIWVADYYRPILRWSLSGKGTKTFVLLFAFASMIFGMILFSQRPFAFLPNFGEPQITIAIDLPASTRILETNALSEQMEQAIRDTIPEEDLNTIQTIIGGGGANFESLLTGGGGVTENIGSITVGMHTGISQSKFDDYTHLLRSEAEAIFDGKENVTVSGASIADSGFGGLELVVSGPIEQLEELDPLIIATLNDVEGIANVSSNLSEAAANTDGPQTYIRINMETALSYTGELETENTIGVTQDAIKALQELEAIQAYPDVVVSQGFDSEIQQQGFNSLPIAMGIAIVIIVIILTFTMSSAVYWLPIIGSIMVAPVGAAIALTLTDRVLGISALIGLLMLIGLVITNAVVLIDRVLSNYHERKMSMYDSLIEAGGRRLRPILMTSLATIIALIPLAIGLSEGAIIAAEMGTVVIGGVVSSTLLTLIVVPVAFSILHPVHLFIVRLIPGQNSKQTNQE